MVTGLGRKPLLGQLPDESHWAREGLVGHWIMNEGAGNKLYDVSLNGNHGDFSGGVSWKSGRDGRTTDYNGVDGSIDLGSPVFLSDTQGSVSAWFNLGVNSPTDTIFALGEDNVVTPGFWTMEIIEDGGLKLNLATDTGEGANNQVRTAQTIAIDTWYNVVITSNGSVWTIYINGVMDTSVGEGSNTGDWFGDMTFTGKDVSIGTIRFDGTDILFWNGFIDNIRVYNRELTPSQANELNYNKYPEYRVRKLYFYAPVAVPIFHHHYQSLRSA